MAFENFVNGEKLNLFAKEIKKNIKNDLLGDKKLRYVTQEEYNALTDDQKNDEGIVYNITDTDIGDYVTKEQLDEVLEESLANMNFEIITDEDIDNIMNSLQ